MANLNKTEFFDIIIRNNIFSILNDIIVKEKIDDEAFLVYFCKYLYLY